MSAKIESLIIVKTKQARNFGDFINHKKLNSIRFIEKALVYMVNLIFCAYVISSISISILTLS
ncbi:hypothetical protein BALOs_2309 [Halobacteriovorax sp. BALOs_7]|nr:hypothetical protein BALOs_2309 [Halobacteriovorax sp. BALOs_7]